MEPFAAHMPPANVAYLPREDSVVSGLRAGNPLALSALFRLYGRHVHRIATRILGPRPHQVNLCVSAVFFEAWHHKRRLEHDGDIALWLTRRTALHAARIARRAWWKQRLGLGPSPHVHPWEIAPDEHAVAAVYALYAVLDTIRPAYRVPFALCFLEGMPATRIAVVLQCPLSRVRRRVAKAHRLFAARAHRCGALAAWLDRWEQEASA